MMDSLCRCRPTGHRCKVKTVNSSKLPGSRLKLNDANVLPGSDRDSKCEHQNHQTLLAPNRSILIIYKILFLNVKIQNEFVLYLWAKEFLVCWRATPCPWAIKRHSNRRGCHPVVPWHSSPTLRVECHGDPVWDRWICRHRSTWNNLANNNSW